MVELRRLCIERYKGYAQRVEVEVAPLTILVGPNNAGKTALAQAIQLLAGGLSTDGKDASEPLPLESGGIHHGAKFTDLVSGRSIHGQLHLAATFADGTSEVSLAATVHTVEVPPRPPERQVSDWRLARDDDEIVLKRLGFDDRLGYQVSVSGTTQHSRQLLWRRLIPTQPSELVGWAGAQVDALQSWALGVRHLQCPRKLVPSPFVTPEIQPEVIGPDGEYSPLLLAANDELRESVRKWYRSAFGTTIDVVAQGPYSVLLAGAPARGTSVPLTQSGRGLSQVLPVAVMALTVPICWPRCRHHRTSRIRVASGCSRACGGTIARKPRGLDASSRRRDTFRNGTTTRPALGRGGTTASQPRSHILDSRGARQWISGAQDQNQRQG